MSPSTLVPPRLRGEQGAKFTSSSTILLPAKSLGAALLSTRVGLG
jgi:hypothetical protein